MIIPRVKLLTKTAKEPTRENAGGLWDLYADGFCDKYLEDFIGYTNLNKPQLEGVVVPRNYRILVKTGISLELPIKYRLSLPSKVNFNFNGIIEDWFFENDERLAGQGINTLKKGLLEYAVADIRSRSGLTIKHGIQVLNSPETIDNSYRKEIGVIIHNTGHKPYTITKGDKIAQMLIRPLYPSKMEIVEHIEDTGRGGYGSTGK